MQMLPFTEDEIMPRRLKLAANVSQHFLTRCDPHGDQHRRGECRNSTGYDEGELSPDADIVEILKHCRVASSRCGIDKSRNETLFGVNAPLEHTRTPYDEVSKLHGRNDPQDDGSAPGSACGNRLLHSLSGLLV